MGGFSEKEARIAKEKELGIYKEHKVRLVRRTETCLPLLKSHEVSQGGGSGHPVLHGAGLP